MTYRQHCPAFCKPARILKVQIQTAEVHIDRAHNRHFIVTDHLLGMNKARRIFVDPHAFGCQTCIIASGNFIDQRLIRNTRRNNPHIHAAFRCQYQRTLHLITDNQIRRGDIDIFLRTLDHVQIDIFPGTLAIQWTVCIRLYITALCGAVSWL